MLVPRPSRDPWGYHLPRPHPWFPLRANLSFTVGFGSGIPGTLLAWWCGAGRDPVVGLIVLTVVAAAVGAVCTPLGALVAAVPLWALDTGFVLNRFGTLTVDHRSLPALGIIQAAAILSSVASAWTRRA
jgi:hypothetical protein